MEKGNFILVKDEEQKNNLLKLGFIMVNNSNGIATFLNCPNKMSSVDKEKITYTNKICI